jgi:hypothetical protein
MTNIDEIKSPFLRKIVEQRGIKDDLVTSLLIVERYLRQPELTNSVVVLMLRAIIKDHSLEAEIVGRELKLGRAITELEMKELQVGIAPLPDARARGLAKAQDPQAA